MAPVINKARLKQRSIIITLLDLETAFEEVNHNLIKSVLAYNHIPEPIQLLAANLYTEFHSYFISDCFSTLPMPVERGVLQGDYLSPLIFNLCFNTYIQSLKQEKYKQLGFLKMTTYSIRFTGFSLLMMLLLLLPMNVKSVVVKLFLKVVSMGMYDNSCGQVFNFWD